MVVDARNSGVSVFCLAARLQLTLGSGTNKITKGSVDHPLPPLVLIILNLFFFFFNNPKS